MMINKKTIMKKKSKCQKNVSQKLEAQNAQIHHMKNQQFRLPFITHKKSLFNIMI